MEQKRKLENKGPEKTDELSAGSPFFKIDSNPESSPVHPVLQLQSLIGNEATTALIQTKLRISQPGDIHEQEADRVAEKVMRMPEPPVQLASDKTAHDLVQTKVETPPTTQVSSELEARIQSNEGRGEPLSCSVRAFFEPRFGVDFSAVRVHADGEADQLNRVLSSRAFTTGQHIFLRQNEYESSGSRGNLLLAHELAHVLQQASPINSQREMPDNKIHPLRAGILQRKIKTNNVPIDDYLKEQGIAEYDNHGSVYSHGGVCPLELKQEIIYSMLSSGRIFVVAGVTAKEAIENLKNHLTARERIVEYTSKSFIFEAGPAEKMNPEYFQRNESGKWEPKSSWLKAAEDVIFNPSGFEYEIACAPLTHSIMVAVNGSENMQLKIPIYDRDDWVPGDWGYIENTAHIEGKTPAGREGQNLIYVGGGQFWGHPAGRKTLNDWICYILKEWNGKPELQNWRTYTKMGLEGTQISK